MSMAASDGDERVLWRTGMADRRRLVKVANASGGADIVPAVSGHRPHVVYGKLRLSKNCSWEIKSGDTVLAYGSVFGGDGLTSNSGGRVEIQPHDEILSETGTAIEIETSATCAVDGHLDIKD